MKQLIILFVFLTSQPLQAQENFLKIRTIEQTIGFSNAASWYFDKGIDVGLGIAAVSNQDIFALNFNIGGEVDIFSNSANEYHALNVSYGRELEIYTWLVVEGYLGLGYINFIKNDYDTDYLRQTNRLANLPLRFNVFFRKGNVFRLGMNSNININSFVTLYTTNLIFQFKFR